MNSLFIRVLTYGLTIIVTVLVVGVLVVPTLVDWNRYKPEIEAAATAATGRRLTIGGNVRLDFLPAPALRLNGVRVANIEGGQAPAMVQADTVNIGVSLSALLSGRIEIDSITVLAPVISLETLADGRANWVFEPGAPPGMGSGVRVRLQRSDIEITIKSGRFQYFDGPTARMEAIDEVDAVIVAATVDGPYRASGQFTRGGLVVDFDGTFGPFAQGRPAPLKLAVWRSDIETRLRFSGRADLSPGRRSISGRLHGEADDFQTLFAALSGLDRDRAPRLLRGDLEFDAVVSVGGGVAEMNGLSFRLGELRAAGAGSFRLGASSVADLAVDIESINLDRFTSRSGGSVRLAGPEGLASQAGRMLADLLETLGPTRVSAHITLGALIHAGGLVRDMKLNGEFGAGKATINRFSARLPGAADVSASGKLTVTDGDVRFDGVFDGGAGNLRGVLEWLGEDTSGIAPDRLRKTAIAGRVSASPNGLRIWDATLDLDVSHLSGKFAVGFWPHRSYDADLTIDRFDYGAYFSSPAMGMSDETTLKLAVSVDRLGLMGAVLRKARIDAEFKEDALVLKEFSFDGDGVRANLSGSVNGFSIIPVFDFVLDLEADALSRLWSMFGGPEPRWAERLGPLTTKAWLTGQLASADLIVETAMAGVRLDLAGGVRLSIRGPRYDLDFTGTHPSLTTLGRLFDPKFAGGAELPGAIKVTANLAGGMDGVEVRSLEARIGPTEVRGSAKIDLGQARPKITGRLTTGVLNFGLLLQNPVAAIAAGATGTTVPPEVKPTTSKDGDGPIWPRSKMSIPKVAFDAELELVPEKLIWGNYSLTDPRLIFDLDANSVALRQITGRLFGGALKGSAWLGGHSNLAGRVRASLKGGDAGAAFAREDGYTLEGGRLDVEIDLASKGLSPYEMIGNLSGSGRLVMRGGAFKGFELAAVNERIAERTRQEGAIELFLAGQSDSGVTDIEGIEGDIRIVDGVLRSDGLRVILDGGSFLATGFVDLLKQEVKARTQLTFDAVPDAPPLEVGLEGTVQEPDVEFRFDAFQEYLLRTTPEQLPAADRR